MYFLKASFKDLLTGCMQQSVFEIKNRYHSKQRKLCQDQSIMLLRATAEKKF
ncbi:hypothetical protein KL86DYS2_13134 [uncultured Dysgonomonas sp.]|uniref:Uncharacterized protein n=1 Tax=uncultured Dysgonomonas sp. TaxID=206096 RepID=A0A212K6M5_9BACT|nr:hypothetical protein KL86DYS2_13134 [uncultured Dysgonomonas sp.]